MGAALVELAGLNAKDPKLVAGLVREVHVVAGAALAMRDQLIRRLCAAVDLARRESERTQPSPPEVTPRFIVEAIEAAMIRTQAEGRPFERELPGLLYLAVAPYFGTDAARRSAAKLGSPG
jgi:hypothetical protein